MTVYVKNLQGVCILICVNMVFEKDNKDYVEVIDGKWRHPFSWHNLD